MTRAATAWLLTLCIWPLLLAEVFLTPIGICIEPVVCDWLPHTHTHLNSTLLTSTSCWFTHSDSPVVDRHTHTLHSSCHIAFNWPILLDDFMFSEERRYILCSISMSSQQDDPWRVPAIVNTYLTHWVTDSRTYQSDEQGEGSHFWFLVSMAVYPLIAWSSPPDW